MSRTDKRSGEFFSRFFIRWWTWVGIEAFISSVAGPRVPKEVF